MLTTRLVEGAPSTGATLTLTSILPRWTAAWMIRRASSSRADRARGSLRAMSRWRWLSDLHSTERLRRGLAISARPYPVMLRIIEASDWLRRGDEGAELRAEESRRAKAVRLEDGDHAVGARLRRGERGPDLLPVVSVVIDHADTAGRGADDLKSPGHPRKARQGGPDRRGGHAQLERDQRRGGSVLEIVYARLRNVEREDTRRPRVERAPGAIRARRDHLEREIGARRDPIGDPADRPGEGARFGTRGVGEELSAILREGAELRSQCLALGASPACRLRRRPRRRRDRDRA